MRSFAQPRRWWLLVVVIILTGAGFLISLRPDAAPVASVLTYKPEPEEKALEPTATPAQHPRLFFTSKDIPGLRERAESTHREIWQPILSFSQGQLGEDPPSMPREKDLDGFRKAGDEMVAFAFAYVITGERQYLELTRQSLLDISSWKYWGDEQGYGSRDLGFHHILMGSAIAYDWVFNDLSAEDRGTIGKAIAARAQESYEASESARSQWDNWWRKAYTQNHHWTNHSALGVAALALEGQDSRSTEWLRAAVENMRRDSYAAQQIGDGSWHEGIPYQNYGLSMTLPFLQNLRTLKGLDLFPHDYLKNYSYWRIYNSLPETQRFALPVGDVDWSYAGAAHGPEGILRFIAREYKDGGAEWMARQLIANVGRTDNVYFAPAYVFEFLYYDPAVASQPPDGLPLARTFSDLEGVIWRTGWGKDDLVFGFKTGAPAGRFFYDAFLAQRYPFDPSSRVDFFHSGHDHLDANSFNLYRGGVDLSSEMADYQKVDTSYHNSLLVDGKGQPRKDPNVDNPQQMEGIQARLESVAETSHFNYLVADATDRYDGILEEFRRYVLFVRPGYLVMVDSIASTSPHRYEWVSHFGESVSREGDWLKGMAEGKNILGVNVVSPGDFTVSRGEDGKPYARVRPSNNVDDVRFATVLFPTDEGRWSDKPDISSLGDNGRMIGMRVRLNGVQDHLIRYRDEDSGTIDDYSLDGTVASISKGADGNLQRLLLGQGVRLSDGEGSRVLIQAPEKVSALEVEYRGSSLSISGRAIRGLRIFAPGVDPRQVTVNGQLTSVSLNGDYVELS